MGDLAKIDTPRDPATIGYPPSLPIEIALKTASLAELKVEYHYSDEEWADLRYDPSFIADLKLAVDMVRQEGMSFKLKAKLQAEELLKKSWQLIHANRDDVPPSVQADLIKATMRWAGYDNKDGIGTGSGNNLAIQINLG